MKRYVWSVVAGLALAFAGAGTASANIGLPIPPEPQPNSGQVVEKQKNDADVDHEQKNVNIASPPVAIAILGSSKAENEQTNVNVSGTEVKQDNDVEGTSGGGCCGQSQTGQQSVGEQRNDADVDHEQENWNVASPPVAIAVLGHAEASNEQKNVNHSTTHVEQDNEVEQKGDGGCCNGRSQSDQQSVEKQKNDADVEHKQKNVNVLSPPIAVAVLGHSKAENEQTNVNFSKTVIDQENEVEQKPGSGRECCKPAPPCSDRCEPTKKHYGSRSPEKHGGSCCGSGNQQTVGEQKNDADVEHKQKNVNLLSPPIAVAVLGHSKAENEQTNVNFSKTVIDQENEVEQKPATPRKVVDRCKGLVYR